ncbi:MAG: EF-hand domain-containing protein [Methylophilales bacterium]|nr:EF-hand domain-containing protein [Methylophilales bacterium]
MTSSIGSNVSSMMSQLFARLDTKKQGYIDKSELQSAFAEVSSTDGASSDSTASADALFAKLDANGDNQVSQDELSTGIQNLASQLESQFHQMRMQGQGQGMPPPPDDSNGGLTKDQLSSMATKIGSQNSEMASKLTDLVNNFDKADSNGDGKVSRQEAQAYDQSSSTSGTSSANANDPFAILMQAVGGSHPAPPQQAGNEGQQHTGAGGAVSAGSKSASAVTSTSSSHDPADTNYDGYVSAQEKLAYYATPVETSSSSNASGTSSTGSTSISSASESLSSLKKIAQLLQAYGITGSYGDQQFSNNNSLLVRA